MATEEIHQPVITDSRKILQEMFEYIGKNLLDKWFPLAVDKENGGYYTDITYDWKIAPVQHKMIVTQARYMWTPST
ncbi:MAG: hypothetical protein M1339_05770, partial [Bacteroidetes bacterium]|nr:hypothetical protein [Bacteroidota bacterium]